MADDSVLQTGEFSHVSFFYPRQQQLSKSKPVPGQGQQQVIECGSQALKKVSSDTWHSQRPSRSWDDQKDRAHWETGDGVGGWGMCGCELETELLISLSVCGECFTHPHEMGRGSVPCREHPCSSRGSARGKGARLSPQHAPSASAPSMRQTAALLARASPSNEA